jgi:hypothetical protein
MADASGATQAALITLYRGDATLQGLMTSGSSPEWSIYDQGGGGIITPTFPYVYVHPITSQKGTAWVMGTDASDVYAQVSVFTRYEGFNQARAIAARIYKLTDGPSGAAPLVITGFATVSATHANRQELEEVQDGLIQHIADRYKIMTQG